MMMAGIEIAESAQNNQAGETIRFESTYLIRNAPRFVENVIVKER